MSSTNTGISAYIVEAEKNSERDRRYIEEMTKLKENVLIRNFVLYLILPTLLVSLVGFRFPYVYVLLAVSETDMCMCSYFQSSHSYLILNNQSSNQAYMFLSMINMTTTKLWMLAMVVAMTVMIYRIRHIQDDTLIKKECVVSMLLCLVSQTFMNGFYIMG